MKRPDAAGDERWIGVDVGASKILATILDGGLVAKRTIKIPTEREGGPRHVAARIASACAELGNGDARARGVGVGFAGLVDPARGVVRSSIMLPGWSEIPLGAELEAALGVPVVVENDATAAGHGEHVALGNPRGLHMILLTVGTGIGGAILIDGTLYRGAGGVAAELGNTTIRSDGPECWCGNRGCLNSLASGDAIRRRALELARDAPGAARRGEPNYRNVEEVAAAAAAGDAAAARAIEEGARALGVGIANFLNIFNPHRVVVAGGVASLGDEYFRWVREEAASRAFREAVELAEIVPSARGYDVGAFGAACLARDAARRGGA